LPDPARATPRARTRRVLPDRHHFVDAARKTVGIGSVGTRCFVVLLAGRDAGGPLLLQLKGARQSVVESHLPSGPHVHPGHRVVTGQRLLRAAGGLLPGWTTGPRGRASYWRRLPDAKGGTDVGVMDPAELPRYARLCGNAPARAHARTGDRAATAACLGGADTFERAVAGFAFRHADQTTADHTTPGAAIAAGVITAAPWV
jgi:hypothetical protein